METTERDMANTVVMLDEAVTERIGAALEELKPWLQQLIRQEIADVFQASTGGLPRHVGLGDTLSIDLSSIVVTGAS
jgi:hypothetical protein